MTRPALRLVEARPVPVVELEDGHRVLIRGRYARTFNTTSNAIRSEQALGILAELGWPIERLIAATPSHRGD